MKTQQKLIIVTLFAVVLALTPMSAAWGDTTSGEMQVSNLQYEPPDGDAQRIKSFTLDNTFNYQSLGTDSGKTTYTLNTSNIQEIVKNQLLPEWSKVATGVFRDQAGQLVDFYGYEKNGGCMSRAGFNAYFDMARGNNDKYKDETWSCWSLRDKLKQTYPSRAGEQNWDQFVVSGVKPISSQSEARTMMAESLHNIEKNFSLTTDDFLDANDGGIDKVRLGSLDDDTETTGFANIVTAINCKGSSKEYDYTSFGIAFYDFEPVPVAAKGLDYVTVQPNDTFKPTTSDKGTNSSYVENKQQQEILHTAMLGDSVTETTSLNLSALASCELEQNMGANIGMSSTETSSATSFWSDDIFGSGSSTDSSSETMSMGMNWGAAWKMAGALGAEEGHSTAKEVSKAVETTIALPPHTATTIDHKTTTSTYTQSYQQPVILNYKVAIFAMSGNCSGAGAGGIYDDNLYEKQSLVIKFDTKDKDSASYGCDATDDLYSRVVANKSVPNYDSQQGRTLESHSTASRFSPSKDIDWNDVESYVSGGYDAPDVASIAKQNYFYETPGKVSADQDKTSSNAGKLYPLYNLASVKTPKTNYVLYSNNTLDRDSLPLSGYDKDNVAFYGFDPEWGEWNRCDENGEIINEGALLDDDPVTLEGDTLVPNVDGDNSQGGTIYLTWKFKAGAEAMTIESGGDQVPGPQDLTDPSIKTPVVRIDVVNIGLDAPVVTAEGSYKGFYKKPINLHNEMTYEVTDKDDVVLETQVYWESREPASRGINVNKNTGDVTFTQPGTYKVRPYVINNSREKVYPSNWLTVVATEHDLMHYDQKDPTCTDYGLKEHYRCSDCGKFFSDADGNTEISAKDSLIDATGHDWGEWTTTKEPGDEAGEQERVCKNDSEHVEKRALYSVQFKMNGHGAAPEKQAVAAGASVKVPQDPTATGYTFDGWFEDKACTTPYDFGATVEDNLTLYAKWNVVKYTAAAMAVGDVTEDENGEIQVSSDAKGSITIVGGQEVTEGSDTQSTDDDYTYWYKEVEYGTTVTLKVNPDEGYGLKDIVAIPVNPDSSLGESFVPSKIGDNTYSFTTPAADVAVLANFAQVTVTYDGNAPEGETASNVPEAEKIPYGSTPAKATGEANEPKVVGYDFGGWFTDKACTKPYLSATALTEDTTLYAKWTTDGTIKVTYTLTWEPDQTDPDDTGEYTDSYQAESGSKAYDPTEDLYDLAGMDLRAAYELYSKDGACWFKDEGLTEPFDFDTPIEATTHLYAKVVPREYTVTYFNGSQDLGSQSVAYNEAIGAIAQDITKPEKDGHSQDELTWATENGAPWNIESNPVTSDLKLFANWPVNKYSVKFDANNGSGKMAAATVEENSEYELPENAFTAPKGKCDLKTWEVKIGSGEAVNKAPGETIDVTANTTVKAIWDGHKWGKWKVTTPATIGANGKETRVCSNDKKHTETRATDRVDPTPLHNGIKAAKDTEKGVKVSEDGKDIDPADQYTTAAERKALNDAIVAAQTVAFNPKSTQKDVDKAVAAVKKAKQIYDAAKKKGKKKSVKPDNQMGEGGTAVGKGASAAVAEKAILGAKDDNDLPGSKYAPLKLKSKKQTKKSVKLTWNKASGAKSYVLYGTACGTKNKFKKLKTFGASTTTYKVTKVAGKKLKKKTYYKFIIVALDKNNKVVSTSKIAHAATKGSKKKANPKGVIVKAKVNKAGKKIKKWKNTSAITLKAGSTPKSLVKSTKLKAKNKKAKKTKIRKHIPIRYESSNPKVVTVNASGVLTAKAKGTATVYVIAQNGIAKNVKVTVK